MAGEGVWWSIPPFLLDEDASPKSDPARRAAQARIAEGSAPYPGPPGVIAPGAHADLLVVEGGPGPGLDWLGDPEANLCPAMKNGRIVKKMLG